MDEAAMPEGVAIIGAGQHGRSTASVLSDRPEVGVAHRVTA